MPAATGYKTSTAATEDIERVKREAGPTMDPVLLEIFGKGDDDPETITGMVKNGRPKVA